MTVLVDTIIIIDYLRDEADAIAFIAELPERPRISAVSVCELFAGAKSRRQEDRIERLLDGSVVLPITQAIGRTAGQHLRRYGRSHGVDDIDALIAATAEHHSLPLATLNVKHFPMIRGLKRAY